MTFIWQSICAALLLVELADTRTELERFLSYLARWSNRKRQRHAAVFLLNLKADTV
jgi:hypothetical protein